jgi:hypothetical protein
MAGTELTARQRAQVDAARELLAGIDSVDLTDMLQAAETVGRLETSLKSMLAIVEERL